MKTQILSKINSASGLALLSLLGGFLMAPNSFADNSNSSSSFADQNFYECIVRQFDASFPGEITLAPNIYETELTDAQLAKMKELNCNYGSTYASSTKITSLEGISKLTGLTSLSVASHNIESVNLWANTKLTALNIGGNKLSQINTQFLTKLAWLEASYNKLEWLSTSNNPALSTLEVSHNKIPHLDLSTNSALKRLEAADNLMQWIILPESDKLTDINIGANHLSNLDLSNQTKLRWIEAAHNSLETLDLSKNKTLSTVSLHDNKLTSITLPNTTTLGFLNVTNNYLSSVDASIASNLSTLFADDIPVIPYAEYNTSDDCVLNATIKFIGEYNTVPNTNDYTYNADNHLITINQLPENGYIVTQETARPDYNANSTYKLALNDEAKAKLAALSSCNKSGVKVPNTGGSLTEDSNGQIIKISVAALTTILLAGFLAVYAYKRKKDQVKFC